MMAALTLLLAYRAPTSPSCPQTVRRSRSALLLTEQEERISQVMELPAAEKLTESARSRGLALALDDGTRKSHSVAENTAFVTGFFKGIATKQSFAQLVATLYFVYEAMEATFDESTEPCVQALDYPVLRRMPALEEDMAYFHGPRWRESVAPSAATQKYVALALTLALTLTLALALALTLTLTLTLTRYTRYLGDLFGGQMMGGMARKSMRLEGDQGTAFYQFDGIQATKPFIEEWYAELNRLELSDAQKQAIVDEGNLVFALNIEVFEELEGNPVQALWTLATASLRSALGLKG